MGTRPVEELLHHLAGLWGPRYHIVCDSAFFHRLRRNGMAWVHIGPKRVHFGAKKREPNSCQFRHGILARRRTRRFAMHRYQVGRPALKRTEFLVRVKSRLQFDGDRVPALTAGTRGPNELLRNIEDFIAVGTLELEHCTTLTLPRSPVDDFKRHNSHGYVREQLSTIPLRMVLTLHSEKSIKIRILSEPSITYRHSREKGHEACRFSQNATGSPMETMPDLKAARPSSSQPRSLRCLGAAYGI